MITNPDSAQGCAGMFDVDSSLNHANGRCAVSETNDRYAGLDYDYNRKMLIGAESLAGCFECDPSTIRRWARNGTMPKPLKVGGRTLWDAEKIRQWIKQGCPRCEED